MVENRPETQVQLQRGPETPAVVFGGAILVLATIAGAICTPKWSASSASGSDSGSKPATLSVSAGDAPAMIIPVDWDERRYPKRLQSLAIDGVDRERLKADLDAGRLRLGRIQVWDSAVEDGDRIRIEAVGFSQELTILNKPTVFFLPFKPGCTVRITAIQDGGGGGVTLGVASILGETPLPSLVVGQTVEIPVL